MFIGTEPVMSVCVLCLLDTLHKTLIKRLPSIINCVNLRRLSIFDKTRHQVKDVIPYLNSSFNKKKCFIDFVNNWK